MDRDIEFGRKLHQQKIERWRRALTDFGYPYEFVPGYEALTALAEAQRTASTRGATPIILPPGNWNSENIAPAARIRKAETELAETLPTAEAGRAYLSEQYHKWHGAELTNSRTVDMGLFDHLQPVVPKPQEANPWLLTDYLYPSMDRVTWEQVAIVEVPTSNHWEVPVYLDWGNWNGVPRSLVLSSVVRHWEETHGARLFAVGNDQLEFSVERRPPRFAEAAALFREHFLFGPDPVELKDTVLAQYAADLLVAETWVFWWD